MWSFRPPLIPNPPRRRRNAVSWKVESEVEGDSFEDMERLQEFMLRTHRPRWRRRNPRLHPYPLPPSPPSEVQREDVPPPLPPPPEPPSEFQRESVPLPPRPPNPPKAAFDVVMSYDAERAAIRGIDTLDAVGEVAIKHGGKLVVGTTANRLVFTFEDSESMYDFHKELEESPTDYGALAVEGILVRGKFPLGQLRTEFLTAPKEQINFRKIDVDAQRMAERAAGEERKLGPALRAMGMPRELVDMVCKKFGVEEGGDGVEARIICPKCGEDVFPPYQACASCGWDGTHPEPNPGNPIFEPVAECPFCGNLNEYRIHVSDDQAGLIRTEVRCARCGHTFHDEELAEELLMDMDENPAKTQSLVGFLDMPREEQSELVHGIGAGFLESGPQFTVIDVVHALRRRGLVGPGTREFNACRDRVREILSSPFPYG